MCSSIKPIWTTAKFIILMHPREFKKTKNGTGRFTHLTLLNSELYIDVDYTEHTAVNTIINDNNNLCFVLYPGKDSLNIAMQKIETDEKQLVIFIIDSTWPCSVKMLRLSKNLQSLPRISFTHAKTSQFQIKEQPHEFCLSTIESTLTVLELLHKQGIEKTENKTFEYFLDPFKAMVKYQIEHINNKRDKLQLEQIQVLNT